MNDFLARSKKAVAGAVTGAAAALVGSLPAALADGVFTLEELWPVLTLTIGGAVLGFAGVWIAPANKTD